MLRTWWYCLVLGAGLQVGCGDDGPIGSTPATGNYAGPYLETSYLSLTIEETDGDVTGTGWTTVGGGPVRHLLVTGTSTPDLQLQFDWDDNVDSLADPGLVAWSLSGRVDERGITGQLMIPGRSPTAVVLERADTAASGAYAWTAQGAVALEERGSAGFDLPNTLALELPGDIVDNGIRVDISSGRPQPGEYTIAPYPAPLSATVFHHWKTGSPRYWLAQTGVLRIDVSTTHALIGRFDLTAVTPTGQDTILVSGSFSAGCRAADRCL